MVQLRCGLLFKCVEVCGKNVVGGDVLVLFIRYLQPQMFWLLYDISYVFLFGCL